MTLQDRLKEYRRKELISQTELAERCGLSYQTINSVENGTQDPSMLTLEKIERVIGKEQE